MPTGSPRPSRRLATVLSAGGPVAWMFHLGVIDALNDARLGSTELLIGTSAGAAVAAAYRTGASTAEIAEALLAPPSPEQRDQVVSAIGGIRHDVGQRFRPMAPKLARHALPGGRGLALALTGILPAGLFPTTGLGDLPGVSEVDAWPDGLWIPSVEAASGQVVVFGRDVLDVSLIDAVEASSAVPAMFSPKRIADIDYVDGAVASSTHAGLAAEIEPDLVVISSVQTRPGNRPIRAGARRRLREERATLDVRGVPSIVVEPDQITTELAAGFPRRGTTVAAELIERGRQQTETAIAAFRSSDTEHPSAETPQ